jgi:ketosteroid isomerase-like protein
VSQENLEVVRRITDVMDREGFAAAFPLFLDAAHEDVEWREDPAWPGAAHYRGIEQVRQVIEDRMDTLDFDQQTEDLIPVDDKVVALVRWRGRGRSSGAAAEMSLAMVWTLRDRAITAIEFFLDRAKALEAVGMGQGVVDVVRRAISAYNRRDLEALREINHPDVEADWSASRGPDAGVYQGVSEVLGFFETYFDTLEQVRIEAEDFIESGDLVVVPNVAHIRGRDGIEAVARSAIVFEVQGGLVVRLRLYQETGEALEAVGLTS